MLSLQHLSLRRHGKLLIEQANFTIYSGYKVGLVGANGSGKTSLFKLILGELEADQGRLEFPPATRIAHMAQEVRASSLAAVAYVLEGDTALSKVMADIQAAEAHNQFDQISALYEHYADLDGYTARSRAEQLLLGLGFQTTDFEQPLSSFSGGWRVRLNLARTLMAPSDLLLLDEPTNHLDLDAIFWLSDWLKRFEGTLIIISHDRDFLDDCTSHTAFLHD
jgi:ATP-binding cassette subfamily F protein 3